MEKLNHLLSHYPPWLILLIIILALWDGILKLVAMWKAAQAKHLAWFICLAIFNTIGILPIIYVLTHREKIEE